MIIMIIVIIIMIIIIILPVHLGGLGIANPSSDANFDYTSSVKVTAPLVEQIVSQVHQLPEDSLIRSAQQEVRAKRAQNWENRAERLKEAALNMVCKDLVTEPVLQDVEGEQLRQGSNKAQDTRLDIHMHMGFGSLSPEC